MGRWIDPVGETKGHDIDEAILLAYMGCNWMKATTLGGLVRAVAWFDRRGISADVFSPITAEPTGQSGGENLAAHWT